MKILNFKQAPLSLTFLKSGEFPTHLKSLQVTFLKNGMKLLPTLTSENLKNNGFRTGVLLEVISDIHRVRTDPEDPMDVRNDPQQDTFFLKKITCIHFQFNHKRIFEELTA